MIWRDMDVGFYKKIQIFDIDGAFLRIDRTYHILCEPGVYSEWWQNADYFRFISQ